MPTRPPRIDPSAPKTMAASLQKEAEDKSREEFPNGLEVTNMRPSRVSIAGLVFLPGDTKVIPPEHAARVRRHQWFGTILREGRVMMPVPVQQAKPTDLGTLDEDKAIAYIKIETDRQVLSRWAKSETRLSVVEALAEKAKSL